MGPNKNDSVHSMGLSLAHLLWKDNGNHLVFVYIDQNNSCIKCIVGEVVEV
jgi:hypothetical protein